MNRAHNFNAGPSALPLEALKKVQAELLDFAGTGMSVMEISHRSKDYEKVHNETIALLRELLTISDDYEVIFLQGGASLQFGMVPLNYLREGQKAGYIMTGSWSEKALDEAKKIGQTYEVASTKEEKYTRIPEVSELKYDKDTAYIHLTSNNTIYGTQWDKLPKIEYDIPVIADMSSDILSKPFNVNDFALIYAGAQKNLGPSGVTVAIIRKDMVEKENSSLTTMLKYSTFTKNNSLYNTPPTIAIYLMGKVLAEVKALGGIDAMYKRNVEKAKLIYDTIDQSNGFYKGHAANAESRSIMNITFRVADEELEKQFLDEAKKQGFVGLNGHRSVGGCRASTYNAVPYESCLALKEYMVDFAKKNG